MERLKAISFIQVWTILGLLCMISIWFLPWRFQVNDDVIMMWLVSGAYTGEPESYVVFIHPILSWVFSKLYTLSPSIPWYPLTWFMIIYLSYLALILSLSQTNMGFNGKNILSLFCLCLFLHFALFLQFTIVSGIAGITGFILLSFSISTKTKGLYLFSIVLFIFSILIRWESFILISLGLGFYFLIFKTFNGILKESKRVLIPFWILITLVGSKVFWENQSEYADFVKYNKARAQVSDHPANYKLLGQDRLPGDSNWFYFSQWMMEGDGLSSEDLETKKVELDIEYFTLNQVFNSLSRLASVMLTEAFKTVFSMMLVGLYLYRFKCSKKSLFYLGSWLSFFLVFNHFYVLNGRVIILFFLPLLYPLILEPTQRLASKRLSLILTVIMLLLFGFHLINFLEEAKGRKIMREEFLVLTKNLPLGSLIVMEGYKENYLNINYSLDKPVPFLSLGWISQSPFQKEKLHNLGLSQLSDAKEYYLLGVDVNQEFYFPGYMNYLGGKYTLESKVVEANFILFHYSQRH
ncbi:hypothetical protein [Algoriphagus chordae]|uniref:Dolichyl-phosphate-mannose-protein mannosyltransferase n=1 Tax=Algoriphagus chordae TaxID=237019 RepID=A0A2W7QGL0_9BACT|nr:hypothetical protein [Algoriphagus chordae]PZX47658.1 hypothetical protein LV85_03848 [Algoriphagus chordae]